VLKQGQYQPMPVEHQVLVIFAVTEGHMDDVEPSDIPEFERGLIAYAKERHGSVLSQIADTGQLPADELVSIIDGYKASIGLGDETGELEA